MHLKIRPNPNGFKLAVNVNLRILLTEAPSKNISMFNEDGNWLCKRRTCIAPNERVRFLIRN